jgi:hypothetical protein
MEPNEKVVGGEILSCGTWGPMQVLGTDGVIYEITIVEGHSGPEFMIEKARSQKERR